MWYIFQLAVIVFVAHEWGLTQNPPPKDMTHGIGLGVIVAWYLTLLLSSIFDFFKKRKIRKSLLIPGLKQIDRR